ncbi:MAG: TetR/AcrR family transcriptional regulator, partial [Planctomycetota bacterium]|jgi:AcrR family transcriptional regulator
MPRPPLARQPIKDAALKLFVTQGVHATGIRDIAKVAGCSEAALYRHWTNKDDLVSSLFVEHLATVVEVLDQTISGDGSVAERLSRIIEQIFAFYDDNPLIFRFVLLVRHEQADFLPEGIRMPQEAMRELVSEQISDSLTANATAAAVIGSILQIAEFVVYDRLPGPLSKHSALAGALCAKMVA